MFSRPFSFKGRIRRTEYGLSFIFFFVLVFIIALLADNNSFIAEYGLPFLIILTYYFLYAQAAKRCHDVGLSAWYLLLPNYILILLFKSGDINENEYGKNPKAIRNK